MKNCLLLFLLASLPTVLFAQQDTTSVPKKDSTGRHSFLKASLDVYSNNVYLGRKDVDQQTIIMPSLTYFHKSGLYVSAGAGYIPQQGYQHFDIKQFEAGYEYSGDKFYGSIAYAKYMFTDSSNAINSSISSSIQLYADYDFNILTVGTGVYTSFSEGTDIILNPVVSHPFYLANDHLTINPQLQAFAGSQNFYESYFNPTNGKGHSGTTHPKGHGNSGSHSGSGSGTGTGSTGTVTIVNYNKFKMLDYELSVPMEYTKGRCTITLTPKYIIPVNPAMLEEDNTLVKEKISNSFVMIAGISFKLGHHS